MLGANGKLLALRNVLISPRRFGIRGRISGEIDNSWQVEPAKPIFVLVESGTAHLHGLPYLRIYVWHINSFLYSIPKRARLLKSCDPREIHPGWAWGSAPFLFDFYHVTAPVLTVATEYRDFHPRAGKKIFVADAQNLVFEPKVFDVSVACDVLEDVFSFRETISETVRVLRHGGYLGVDLPWEQDLKVILMELGSDMKSFNARKVGRSFRGFTAAKLEIRPERQRPSRIQSANPVLVRI